MNEFWSFVIFAVLIVGALLAILHATQQRFACECGKNFKSKQAYRDHWAIQHGLDHINDPDYPSQTEYQPGVWGPSIPEPFYGRKHPQAKMKQPVPQEQWDGVEVFRSSGRSVRWRNTDVGTIYDKGLTFDEVQELYEADREPNVE